MGHTVKQLKCNICMPIISHFEQNHSYNAVFLTVNGQNYGLSHCSESSLFESMQIRADFKKNDNDDHFTEND